MVSLRDPTPEMLTHTRVVDLKTWQLTEEWEQGEWVDPPDVPVRHVDRTAGTAIASVSGCAGDWFGQTGYDEVNADLFITADLAHGRLPTVLAAQRPCILVGHWPCFYVNDQVGFKVLKEVKRRLDAWDPDGTKTLWMKTSEIGHYWMARELTEVQVSLDTGAKQCTIRTATKFPTDNFTLAVHDWAAKRVQKDGTDLPLVKSRRDFRSGTFLVEGNETFIAMNLAAGAMILTVAR